MGKLHQGFADRGTIMRSSARHREFASPFFRSLKTWEEGSATYLNGMEVVRIGRGEPIVMVPGLAGGWRLLAPLARLLARRHEVILVGLRGDTGFPRPGSPQKVADHARDLSETLSHLGLERPTLFGLSFGGAVALELAVEQPASVGGLVVFGTSDRFPFNLGTTIAVRALERFPLPRDSRFVNQFFNILHGCRPEPGPLVDFIVKNCWETDQAIVARRLRGLEEFAIEDRLWRIDCPSLVLAGIRDVVVAPHSQKALSTRIAGAGFQIIDGAGHIGFLTHRAQIAEIVGDMVHDRSRSYC